MPPKGFLTLTLPESLVNDLKTEATNKNVSVPKLLGDFLSTKEKAPNEIGKEIGNEAGKGSEVGNGVGKYFVEVSERAHRILTYAQKVYNKSMPEIVEKLIDAPLNVISLQDRHVLRKEESKEPSNFDLIRQGLALLHDLDPEGAEACQTRLEEICINA